MMIHLGYLCHIVISQCKIEDVDVLYHTLFVARLGNGHDAALGEPA